MSDTKRKIFIIIVLVLVILFGVGQFFAGANLNTAANQQSTQDQTNNVPPPTTVIAYQPMPVENISTEQGSCFANSVAAPYRSDAWRCSVGNAIHDPCFQVPGSNNLLCDTLPGQQSSKFMFLLQLTEPLPKPEIASGTSPSNWAWFVEFEDGTVCTPFTGTRPFAKSGEVATYSCSAPAFGSSASGTADRMIFGDLNNASTTWTAEVGSLSTATSTFPPAIVASATVPVYEVWQ